MAEKFQGKYRIASTRAKWHHYNDGAYFITINTAFREHYFGKIADNKMIFSEFGKFLDDQIVHIKEHYPYAEIPVHQVIPNHVHLIIFIDTPIRRDVACHVLNDGDSGKDVVCHVLNDDDDRDVARHVSTEGKNEKMQKLALRKGKLSVVIGGIKSAVSKFANQNNIEFKWQDRFHDHII